MTKYIFVTGGVVSGLGKGITAASIGRLLKDRGLKIYSQKLDPYINVDPGTMSPFQHGEVFVTDDGAETDLDLGHYERFIDNDLNKYSNLTTGKVYWNVINKERQGAYLGQTVQVIPHITNEIKKFILEGGKSANADICITEVGGTIGDMESQPFIEAIREIALTIGKENCLFIHVTLVPYIASSGEQKSKPTQHSVRELQAMGVFPDIIIARTSEPLEESIKDKIALFCNVKKDCVIENSNVEQLYEAPMMLEKSNISDIVCRELHLDVPKSDNAQWKQMLEEIYNRKYTINVALVGKYIKLHDAYISVAEALRHGGYENSARIIIHWTEAEKVTKDTVDDILQGMDGIVVPGGFGDRGIEGKILAAKYARENKIPYLGLCLGMQIAVIEFARDVMNYQKANSTEFDAKTAYPVIDLMPEQKGVSDKGATMRLGSYPCVIKEGTKMAEAYGTTEIAERHRHRFEFNNEYRQAFEAKGLTIAGTSPNNHLVEAVELKDHPFYVGVQFHPEFKSRPTKAHPLFKAFIKAALTNYQQKQS